LRDLVERATAQHPPDAGEARAIIADYLDALERGGIPGEDEDEEGDEAEAGDREP